MSANSAPSASASSAASLANQEILATMARIEIMLVEVRNSHSDKDKIRLSKLIGDQVVSFLIV